MVLAGIIESTIAIPEGVTVTQVDDVLTVRGPKGELSRNFAHPRVKITVREEDVLVSCEYPRMREKAMNGTFSAHVRNMIRGVTEGYTYGLKTVYSHFPMKVTVTGDKVEVSNYLGERTQSRKETCGTGRRTEKGRRASQGRTLQSQNQEQRGSEELPFRHQETSEGRTSPGQRKAQNDDGRDERSGKPS